MATIKSYTDLSQSKKLAEILPIESADNVVISFGGREGVKTAVMPFETLNAIRTPFSDVREVIPCWSLASLLGVLPRKVELEDTAYTIGVSLDSINYSNVNNGNLLLEVKVKDNLVDACYEVIIKLYELKML